MAEIVHIADGALSANAAQFEDRFAIAFAPARPVERAMLKLRKVRNFIADRDRWDPKRNENLFARLTQSERLDLIPDVATLQNAKRLFHEAEHVPAPEEWLHLVIGVYLAAAPNGGKVGVDYNFGLVDSMLFDEEAHRGYDEMGYSAAVVVQAIREVRRECKYVASAQEILEACDKHRRAFRKLGDDVDVMISVREEAELPPPPPDDEDWSDIPF
jgi:hypothetical protein